jgi:hypothetical protein
VILGLSTATFTLLHVLISVVGIASGLVVMYGFLASKRVARWTAIFLATTFLTSLTGFAFPFDHLLPSHIVGILSLLVLTISAFALYGLHLRGAWRSIYVVSASIALYFNVFVLVVQSFEKVPILNALAPTQKESPFAIVQVLVLAAFIVLTVMAVRRFKKRQSLVGSPEMVTPKKRVA